MNKEEAIKVLNARPYTGEVREALETLIPELKESEGERIRKTLINALKTTKSVGELKFVLPEPIREECITYLEKQKERGPLTKEEEYILHRIIEYLEDETCPPEWISLLQDIYCLPYEKQKEQKPFWNPTEEDVVLFNKAITTNMTLTPQERAKLDIIRMKFKHCPYIEQKEQKTAEWSEENKKIVLALQHALNCADAQNAIAKSGIQVSEVATFLQDLIPSWKPSEEQMKEYSYWYRNFIESGLASPTSKAVTVLGELLEQLKKLM